MIQVGCYSVIWSLLISLTQDGDNLNDTLTETPRDVVSNWPSLRESGFY